MESVITTRGTGDHDALECDHDGVERVNTMAWRAQPNKKNTRNWSGQRRSTPQNRSCGRGGGSENRSFRQPGRSNNSYRLMLAKARSPNLDVTQTELDAAYADAKKNIPDDAFQQELTRRSLTAADMREGLRRELLAQKVIKQEMESKIAVSDREVSDAFNANRAEFNVAEESSHIAQIVVTTRITDTLRARKEQLLRAAYRTATRGDAKTVNYFARRLIESKGVMPSVLPAAPGGK
jgi:hypothetical protein